MIYDERIDVLVNNAGYDVMGAVEDISIDEFKSQFGPISLGWLGLLNIIR